MSTDDEQIKQLREAYLQVQKGKLKVHDFYLMHSNSSLQNINDKILPLTNDTFYNKLADVIYEEGITNQDDNNDIMTSQTNYEKKINYI